MTVQAETITVELPVLIKTRQASELLSVSLPTIYHLIDSGSLEAYAVNNARKERTHVRITQRSLLAYYKKRFGHELLDSLKHRFKP